MAASTPDGHLTWYVINYFGFMTEPEWLAYRAFSAQEKAKHPPSLLEYLRTNNPEAYRALLAEEEAEYANSPDPLEGLRTSNPEAFALMTDGREEFMRRVRDRILRDHRDKVFLNNCPRCGGLAMTPKAQQCRWCFYDWHQREQVPTSRWFAAEASMKSRAILIGMAWLLYAVSWFLPVIDGGTTLSQGELPGWEAFRVALGGNFLEVSSALTNFVMIASPVILLGRFDRLKVALPWLSILAALLNMQWFILSENRAELRVGYYLWCASFFILVAGCLLNLRAGRAAGAASGNASRNSGSRQGYKWI